MPKIITVDYRKLVQLFIADGFSISRTKGDHISMTKPGIKRPVVIKTSPHKVAVTHIRTNLTTANMSREKYFELLEKVK